MKVCVCKVVLVKDIGNLLTSCMTSLTTALQWLWIMVRKAPVTTRLTIYLDHHAQEIKRQATMAITPPTTHVPYFICSLCKTNVKESPKQLATLTENSKNETWRLGRFMRFEVAKWVKVWTIGHESVGSIPSRGNCWWDQLFYFNYPQHAFSIIRVIVNGCGM